MIEFIVLGVIVLLSIICLISSMAISFSIASKANNIPKCDPTCPDKPSDDPCNDCPTSINGLGKASAWLIIIALILMIIAVIMTIVLIITSPFKYAGKALSVGKDIYHGAKSCTELLAAQNATNAAKIPSNTASAIQKAKAAVAAASNPVATA